MDYAKLIFCLRKNRVYRITKPREVIVAGNENVLHATVFEVCTYACIEACRLIFRYPSAKDLFLTFHVYAQHRIHAFRDNFVVLARIEHDSIKENHRVNRFKWTVLPLVDLGQDFVGYPRNQPLRNFGSVDLL